MAKKNPIRKKDISRKKRQQKREQPKTWMQCGKHKICVEELLHEVNEFDKSFGLKLKNPEVMADPYMYKNICAARTDMNIGAMICAINGIEVSDYFETDKSKAQYGTICKPIGIMHPLFTDASCLNWNDEHTLYKTDSLMFRCRYTTLVLSSILGRADDIAARKVKTRGKYKHSYDEQEIIATKELINDAYRFTRCMITPGSEYRNIILKMHENVSYTKKKVNHRKLRKEMNSIIMTGRRFSQFELLAGRKFFDDDQCIDYYLRSAYMLATNDANHEDHCLDFKHIENATFKHDLLKLIEDLGENIIINCKGKKYSPMFKAFVESRPSIWTQFYKESENNCAVKMGIMALAYAKFVYNDKTTDKYFDMMLKRGI